MLFNIEFNETDKLYVKVSGDLDINNIAKLREEVLVQYEDIDKDIVFDFIDLDYIDSTGLGVLISVYKRVKEKDNQIYIKNAKKNIKKLFYITELDQIFNLED